MTGVALVALWAGLCIAFGVPWDAALYVGALLICGTAYVWGLER